MSGAMHGGAATGRRDWRTPRDLFDRLTAEFHFDLDAAATAESALCERWIGPPRDALAEPWEGRVFVNPPYGQHELPRWAAKAWRASRVSAELVVLLVPARTDAAWWHEWASRADEIRFIRGRLRFEGAPWTAPFPSALVVFRAPRGTPVQRDAARLLFDPEPRP